METAVKRLYEALFLVDSGLAASQWDEVCDMIKQMIEKLDGEVVTLKKWDERKLAYEVSGKARGTYILVYFNAVPESIAAIERNVTLSEKLIRVLILKTDQMTQEDIERATPFETNESQSGEFKEGDSEEQSGDDKSDDSQDGSDNES